MKRIFVTGAGGFIGSHLMARLAAEGYGLTALLRTGFRTAEGRPELPPETRVVNGDIRRPETYAAALPGHAALYHLAADYRIGVVAARQRSRMFHTNVTGALEVTKAAHAAGIPHIVHASTTAALGETNGLYPDETHRHNGTFRCYYEETKHIAHEVLRRRQAEGMPLTMAILGGVFGPGDTSVLGTTLRAFFQGKIPFQVATTSRFQLCHVRHVCDALVRLLDERTIGQSYLITGQDFSMPDIFSLLAEISGKAIPSKRPASHLRSLAWAMDRLAQAGFTMPLSGEALRIMDGSTYTYTSEKIRRELGWSADDVVSEFRDYATGVMKEMQ